MNFRHIWVQNPEAGGLRLVTSCLKPQFPLSVNGADDSADLEVEAVVPIKQRQFGAFRWFLAPSKYSGKLSEYSSTVTVCRVYHM